MNRIIIDRDKDLSYEVNSPARKAVNAVLIPILNALPVGIRPYLKMSHKSGKEIIENVTSHKALEVLYGYSSSAKSRAKPVQRFFRSIWLNTNNSKAVRNRLKLVRRELKSELSRLAAEKKEIKMLSIASGSAHAVMESTAEISAGNTSVSVTFVDKNPSAIAHSKEISKDHPHRQSFRWVEGSATEFFDLHAKGETFNVVEIVGLIDYFDDEKAVRMFSRIYKALDPGGMLITANISDNKERPFITKAVGWNMIYRSADELVRVLKSSGFEEGKMSVYYEPQGIHCVVIARK